jgi:hypothetical protein
MMPLTTRRGTFGGNRLASLRYIAAASEAYVLHSSPARGANLPGTSREFRARPRTSSSSDELVESTASPGDESIIASDDRPSFNSTFSAELTEAPVTAQARGTRAPNSVPVTDHTGRDCKHDGSPNKSIPHD